MVRCVVLLSVCVCCIGCLLDLFLLSFGVDLPAMLVVVRSVLGVGGREVSRRNRLTITTTHTVHEVSGWLGAARWLCCCWLVGWMSGDVVPLVARLRLELICRTDCFLPPYPLEPADRRSPHHLHTNTHNAYIVSSPHICEQYVVCHV